MVFVYVPEREVTVTLYGIPAITWDVLKSYLCAAHVRILDDEHIAVVKFSKRLYAEEYVQAFVDAELGKLRSVWGLAADYNDGFLHTYYRQSNRQWIHRTRKCHE